jgi:hypothetical protein
MQNGEHAARGAGEWRTPTRPEPVALERTRHTRLSAHRGEVRQPDRASDLGCRQSSGRRTTHDQADVGIHPDEPLTDGRGCGAGPHVGRGDDGDEISGRERGLHGRSRAPRQVADDRRAPTRTRVDHRIEGGCIDVATCSTRRQHGDAAMFGQRRLLRGPSDASTLKGEI